MWPTVGYSTDFSERFGECGYIGVAAQHAGMSLGEHQPSRRSELGWRTGAEKTCPRQEQLSSREKQAFDAAEDPRGAYTEITARLADAEGDVLPCLAHGQEVLCLQASAPSFPMELNPRFACRGGDFVELPTFLRSLEFDLQCFVHARFLGPTTFCPQTPSYSRRSSSIDRAAVADSVVWETR